MQQRIVTNNQGALRAGKADFEYESIVRQVEGLDRQNRKLVAIADNIMKTSFLRTSHQTPAVISQLEEQMRGSFNALIQSIRQFFITIDDKLRKLASVVETRLGDSDIPSRLTVTQRGDDRLENLMARMGSLESNLRKTQENEARLIAIIEQMTVNKTQADQQPTILKYSDKHLPQSPTQPKLAHENSFRLFSAKQSVHQGQGYHGPQTYSVIQSQYAHEQPSRGIAYPIMSFCPPPRESQRPIGVGMGIIPEKAGRGDLMGKMENSNRGHRLSYLMKALKE